MCCLCTAVKFIGVLGFDRGDLWVAALFCKFALTYNLIEQKVSIFGELPKGRFKNSDYSPSNPCSVF